MSARTRLKQAFDLSVRCVNEADPEAVERGRQIWEACDAELQAKPTATTEQYGAWLCLTARDIADGRAGIDGVGFNLARAVMVLRLAEWIEDPLTFSQVIEIIDIAGKQLLKVRS